MWSSLRTKRKDRIRGSDKPKKRGRSLVRILAAVLVLFLFPVTSFASNSGNAGSGTGRHNGNVFTFYYDYDANQNAIVLTVRTTHPTNTYGGKTSHIYSYTDKTNVPSNNPHIAAGHTMADAMNQASAKWNVSGWETALGQPSTTVDGQISGYERGGDQNQIWYVKGNHSRTLTFFSLSGRLSPARTVVRQQDWTCTQDGYTQWSDGSYTDQVRHPGHIESSWQDGGADHYKYCTRSEHGCGHSILSREKHHFGPWTDSGIDHYRTCKDCRHVERGNHSYNAWKDDPDRPGWQKHTCVDCGHPEWRDIEPPTVSVSANPSGKWTAGDVTVTIKAKDRGSGLSSVLLYRTNTLDKTTSCVKTYSFKGQTDEQTCSFTETNEGRFTYYAIASDKSNNKKQSDPTKEAMLDHSDPKQTVFIGGQSTKTETRQGTKKVYQPGAKKTVTETKDVPKVPVYEDATSQINGAGKAVKYNNITYELNGGEATGNTPSDYIHGTETKIGNAKRTGYTFAGWIVTCDGQKLNSTPAKDVIIGSKSTGDLTFSAQWSTIYGIKFDSGADDAAGTMDPIPIGTVQKGQSYTLPKNKFSRTGYTFAGWNDQPDGSGKNYADGATVKDLVNRTGVYAALYAEWKPITYKISYDLNGGSISEQPTSYTYGSTTYIPQPSRSEYVFAGWTINGGSERYANVTISSTYHENVSLSATWTKCLSGTHTVHHPYIMDWVWVADAYAAIAGHPEWMQQYTTKTWTTGGAQIGDPCTVAEKAYRNDEANIIPDSQYPYQWANSTLANWFANAYGWSTTTEDDPYGRFTANKYYPVFQGKAHDFGYDSQEKYNYWSPYEPSDSSLTIGVTGWVYTNGYWYYYCTLEDCKAWGPKYHECMMLRNTWMDWNGKRYYFDANGHCTNP